MIARKWSGCAAVSGTTLTNPVCRNRYGGVESGRQGIEMPQLETVCDREVATGEPVTDHNSDRALFERISEKERAALRLTLLGKTSKEIARELKVSPRAIDQRLDSARRKFGVSERNEAARKFYELYCASEGLTSDPFLLGEGAGRQRSDGGEQSHYVFGKALAFSAPAVWDTNAKTETETWRRFVPGLPSAASGTRDRIMWIVIGAAAILLLVVVGLAAKDSLRRAFHGG